jgi:hypothetical protein
MTLFKFAQTFRLEREGLMAQKHDIMTTTTSTERTLSCKRCKKVFARIPLSVVERQKVERVWDQEEERMVQQHLQMCAASQ